MRTGISITAFWASVALSCASACAQDTNRVPDIIQGVDAVDVSIHSDSVERALQKPQPSKEHVKLSTTYSRWAFNSSGQLPPTQYLPVYTIFTTSTAAPADGKSPSTFSSPSFRAGAQPPATAGWSSHATDTKIAPEKDVNFGKFERQPSLYNSLDIGRTQHSSTGPQRLKTAVPPNSPLPQADGYLTPFREKEFGLTNDSFSLPTAFPKTSFSSERNQVTASRRKSYLKKSPYSKHTGAIGGISNGRENPGRSRLTSKAAD
jgi:hypothetical protein